MIYIKYKGLVLSVSKRRKLRRVYKSIVWGWKWGYIAPMPPPRIDLKPVLSDGVGVFLYRFISAMLPFYLT